MKAKAVFALVATLLIFVLGTQGGFSQEEQSPDFDTSQILGKLEEVLANQAQMLEQIEQLKEELRIIKVRSTR